MEAAKDADAKLRTEIQLALGAIGPAAAPATEMLVKSIGRPITASEKCLVRPPPDWTRRKGSDSSAAEADECRRHI